MIRIVLLVLSVLLLANFHASYALPRPGNAQNVLLVISDDLRAEIDSMGFKCTAAKCHTPNLADFARSEGTVSFTRAYVQQALCAPSRNSFLTGRRPDATKSWNFVDHFREPGVGKEWISFPQFFKENGWDVFGTGKIFHPHLPPNWDLPYSWDDRMSNGDWEGWMYPAEPRCPKGDVWCGIESDNYMDFEDTQTTKRALQILGNLTSTKKEKADEASKPWFLAVGYRKPHVQWRVPQQYIDDIPESSVNLPKHRLFPAGAPDVAFHRPENDFLQPFTDVSQCGGTKLMAPNASFPDKCVLKWRRAYHASVAFMDAQFGILLNELKSLGVENDTVVVFFGDHGWQLGEWAEWEKFTNFELAARVPLIIRAPWTSQVDKGASRAPATATNKLVELIDVMPTIIELASPAEVHVPSTLDGSSLTPLFPGLGGEGKWGKNKTLTQFPRCCTPGQPLWKANDCDSTPRTEFTHMGLSIRTDRWRYTRWLRWDGNKVAPDWSQPDDGVELYDHNGDDGLSTDGDYENINVASQYPAIVQQLELELRRSFDGPLTLLNPAATVV